jgi:hypothetical protein
MFPKVLRDSVSVKVPSEHRAVDASRRTREMARWSLEAETRLLGLVKSRMKAERITHPGASTVRRQHTRCVTPLHHGGGEAAGITSVDRGLSIESPFHVHVH